MSFDGVMVPMKDGDCQSKHEPAKAQGNFPSGPSGYQEVVEASEGRSPSPNWTWARLLKRVFSIDMERCPVCQQGRLRIIAAITEVGVIKKILRYLKLAVDPPPIAPAQQAAFA